MTDPGDIAARLDAQMAFLAEADKLKTVIRATRVTGRRYENAAEHSWHIALYAFTLAEHAAEAVDIAKVIGMLLIHDLVEIDAGDTPIFAEVDEAAKTAAETAAAERIFGLLPDDQARRFRALWDEFEAGESAEARFARSVDRFSPPNLNIADGGGSWADYDVSWDTFESRIAPRIACGAPGLWTWLKPRARVVFDALAKRS
jgi:putative hydrolase of HD superfamily